MSNALWKCDTCGEIGEQTKEHTCPMHKPVCLHRQNSAGEPRCMHRLLPRYKWHVDPVCPHNEQLEKVLIEGKRAGGETPAIDLEATLTDGPELLNRAIDEALVPGDGRLSAHTIELLKELRDGLRARHRDGEWTCHAERNCGPHDAGCGKSIAAGEEYRCLDCDAVMHKDCLRAHCSADEKDATILRLQLTIQSRDDILERICAEMPDASAGPSPERAPK